MGKQYTLIDVDPVSSARDKSGAGNKVGASAADSFQAPSYGKKAAGAARSAATIIDSAGAKKPGRIGGAVQTAVGGAIMAVGVPMLILPGPGLLAIGSGAVIAGGGIKKLLGK